MRKIKHRPFKPHPLRLRGDWEVIYAPDEISAILIRYDFEKRREEKEAERQRQLAEEAAELQRQERWNTLITNLRRICNATD